MSACSHSHLMGHNTPSFLPEMAQGPSLEALTDKSCLLLCDLCIMLLKSLVPLCHVTYAAKATCCNSTSSSQLEAA